MNTMEAIAQILKREGVEWVSCFPSNNLLEEVAKVGIRPVMFRQERGALMAADGFSRMNDRNAFGVAITQGGGGGGAPRTRWVGWRRPGPTTCQFSTCPVASLSPSVA